jgi:hypothetical protein
MSLLAAGSSSAPGSDVIKTIRDSKTDFTTMVYIINAGCDYQFWQVRLLQPYSQHMLSSFCLQVQQQFVWCCYSTRHVLIK